MPNIFELCLNNIKINGGFLEGKVFGISDVVEEMIRTLAL